ncbi:Foie gras liver health family 1 [Nesidiocoris tenuis]|uniref:Foie gras liver health family 1 n=1 Tax=Nesidiocoris tenuis TaxID=355587 RepID=A0ABN7AM14_9HEMI|nr:Foie gras liver health family 1 [Nesidiocoris tenuis]
MSDTKIMNGAADRIPEIHINERKPIVTYAGDKELFLSLEPTLSSSLPNEPAEWRRAYGRAIKMVNVSATFVPFAKDVLPKEGDFRLIDQPVLHTYWTQCSDVDAYKSTVREDIEMWMRVLLQYNLNDWVIILVETYDFRKSNKLLPRTTVFDKIKSDYGTKHADRCLAVINPLRSESRSVGSWRGLVVNLRLLLLTAFDRSLIKFEEIIREQREKRNQAGWSFTKYFLLQEELAFVLEMLGVYEEALVQYDELDALFTQFILNFNLGETPEWLAQFQSSLDSWDGLSITTGVILKERTRIQENKASLLQFRNYLFSRQCAMLLYSNKPSEVAERTLPYLHNCIRELSLLDVVMTPGASACWVFLSCLEILQTCENYKETAHVESYSKFTAGIWSYARQKLEELGRLCGLMPGQKQTSEQIHTSVQLFAGLIEESAKPVEKLKKALSCHEEFTKQYLELSELAMGTYKHIGRARSARSLGFDLAKFYWSIGDYATATSFLQNALHCYEQDGWKQLAASARLHLAESYLKLGDMLKYAKMCLSIACTPELDIAIRLKNYEYLKTTLASANPDPPWTGLLTDCLTLEDVDIQVDQGSTKVTAVFNVMCHLPVETTVSTISAAISHHGLKNDKRHRDSVDNNSIKKSKESLAPVNPFLQRLPLSVRLDYKQDKSLASANVEVKNQKSLVRRTDSHGKYRKISTVTKADFARSLTCHDVTLKPGPNTLVLSSEVNESGSYRLNQLSVMLFDNFELLSPPHQQKIQFEVLHTLPTVALTNSSELLAGLVQTAVLQVTSQGHHIAEGSALELRSSTGLTMQQSANEEDAMDERLTVELPEIMANSTYNVPILIYAALPSYKETSPIVHSISIRTPWAHEEELISLQLQPALYAVLKLHSASANGKFLFVTVAGLSSQPIRVHDPAMTVVSPPGITIAPCNSSAKNIVVDNEKKASFMWRMESMHNVKATPVKTEFSLYYETDDESDSNIPLLYKCLFELSNFMTLYIVECKVEPGRGSEFCRVSTVCQLFIKVTRSTDCGSDSSLMYEVFAEHNMWAVCGKALGVLTWDDKSNEQSVTVDVMPLVNGFLPLPTVRLSKYIPANSRYNNMRLDHQPHLEQFSAGQVYNSSKGAQVHVITASSPQDM